MRARRHAVIALVGAAPLVFFHEVCLQGKIFLLRDLFNWFYPWRSFAARSLAAGDFPLWNPYSYAGTPFLANMQSGLLYPPNLVFWIFDFPVAMRLFVIAQFGMAAGFTYILLRNLSCRVSSSITGALAYAYSGWMLVHIEFPNKLAAAAWLPLVILGIVHCRRGRPRTGVLVGGLALACCITAGYPQTSYTVMLGAGVVWLVLGIRSLREALRGQGRPRAAGVTFSLPAMGALGSLLAAAQILPFLEAVALSTRADPLGTVLARGLAPVHFASLVYPRLFGLPGYARYWGGDLYQFWLGHFYVGLATLILALAAASVFLGRADGDGAATSRRWWTAAAFVLCIVSITLCLGDRTPLGAVLAAWLPGFSFIKWISTTSVLLAFSLAWLAAFGLDAARSLLESRRRSPAWTGGVAAGCLLLGTVAAVAAMAPGRFEILIRRIVASVILPAQEPLLAGHIEIVRGDAIRAALVSILLTGAWLAARAGWVRPARFAAAVPLVLFLDLKAASSGINHVTSPAIYREVPEIVTRLKREPDPLFRIYVPETTLSEDRRMYGSEDDALFRWAANTQLFNLNLPHGIYSLSDGDPLQTARTGIYRRAIEAGPGNEQRRRLLAAGNVGLVLQAGAGLETELVEVPGRHPRVYLAAGARAVERDEALEIMRDTEWDPLVEVLVEGDFPGTPRPPIGVGTPQTVHSIVHTNNTVTIDAESARGAYLVLADAFYPGWVATIDGVRTDIFTANHLFRGIDFPAGRHEVVFRYEPRPVLWGAIGSIAGLVAVAILAAGGRRRGSAGAAAGSPEQAEDRHEDGGSHHGVDRGKEPAVGKRDVERKRRQTDAARDPAAEGPTDESQRDRAETPDAVRGSREAGAHGPAQRGHREENDPVEHRSAPTS